VNWQELYDDAVKSFGGQTPARQLEAELVEIFEAEPATVQAAITKITGAYQQGRVRAPWAVVKVELERNAARRAVTVEVAPDRARLERLAEIRIRNIGHELPTASELREELFGPRALLEPWAGDEALVERMTALWRRTARPPIEWPKQREKG
jgi:hypothetical protein